MSEGQSGAARVFLKPTQPEDIDDAFCAMFANHRLKNRYFRLSGGSFTRDELVRFCRDGIERGNVFYYSVCAIDDATVIGSVRIGPIDFQHSLSDLVTLIGNVGDRGKGLGTEAIRPGSQIAFREHNIRKLSGGVLSPNLSSLRAYLRAGWIEEGRLAAHCMIDGELVDWIIISRINPNWGGSD